MTNEKVNEPKRGSVIDSVPGFLATFGDSLKRNIICSSCTPRRRGQALPASDSLPCVHDVGPDGTATAGRAISQASTHLRDTTPHDPPRLWRHAWLRGLGFPVSL